MKTSKILAVLLGVLVVPGLGIMSLFIYMSLNHPGYCKDIESVVSKPVCEGLSGSERIMLKEYLELQELLERLQLPGPDAVAPAIRTSDTTISILLGADDVEPAR